RGLPRTSGSFSIAALRILASPLGESVSPVISGTTFERSRMRPWESMIPGFSRPLGPKRTSFMNSPWGLGLFGAWIMRRLSVRGKKAAERWSFHCQSNQRARQTRSATSPACAGAKTPSARRDCAACRGIPLQGNPTAGVSVAAPCALYLLPMGNRCADIVQGRLFTRRFRLQWALCADRLASCTWSVRLAASDTGSGADTMASPLPGLCRVIGLNWGVRRGWRKLASFAFGGSHHARIEPASDEQALPGDIAGLRRAQKSASRAELSRRTESLSRHARHPLVSGRVDRDAALLGGHCHVGGESFGVESAGQKKIDRDVGGGDRARDAGEKRGQACARPRREIEPGERHLHRA